MKVAINREYTEKEIDSLLYKYEYIKKEEIKCQV